MTRVEGQVRRAKLNGATFVDITGPGVSLVRIAPDFLEFDGDLTPAQVEAVWARMDSCDDADQAKRAALRADRDALAAGDKLRRLYDAVLGD